MGAAFSRNWSWPCTGRMPEREAPSNKSAQHCEKCNIKTARIIQRQASNLRVPELVTLFAIPPRCTELHALLELEPVLKFLQWYPPTDRSALEGSLNKLVQLRLIGQDHAYDILRYSWNEIIAAIKDVSTPVLNTYEDLILEEFNALRDGSLNGIPSLSGPNKSSPFLIEIKLPAVRSVSVDQLCFRIAPVSKLSTVTVQKGYRREVDTEYRREGDTEVLAKIVDVSFADSNKTKWYPGVQFMGEGIFVTRDPVDGWQDAPCGESSERWSSAADQPSKYDDVHVFRDSRHRTELSPAFVWWHTLSHLLLRAIAVDAGYSSASIRERVYLEKQGNRTRGGVLLYATQPGSEGSLGGLIALVPQFSKFLERAMQNAGSCSGDPLCKNHAFKAGYYNGAACYGCLLLPETSCEHRNMWLDRTVLLENLR